MQKENGRLSPKNKEEGNLKSKPFKCNKCGEVFNLRNVEFGSRMVCPSCDLGILIEDI